MTVKDMKIPLLSLDIRGMRGLHKQGTCINYLLCKNLCACGICSSHIYMHGCNNIYIMYSVATNVWNPLGKGEGALILSYKIVSAIWVKCLTVYSPSQLSDVKV